MAALAGTYRKEKGKFFEESKNLYLEQEGEVVHRFTTSKTLSDNIIVFAFNYQTYVYYLYLDVCHLYCSTFILDASDFFLVLFFSVSKT